MCHCEDRAKECNNIQGCTDCNPGWEGDQCLNNTDECAQPDICPDNSQVRPNFIKLLHLYEYVYDIIENKGNKPIC